MNKERLGGLALISINRELAQQISYEAVIDDFALKKKQKNASVGGHGHDQVIIIIRRRKTGPDDLSYFFFRVDLS